MERYCVSTDKESGITNNANDWALEHKKSRYILDLILSVINVSCQTVDIVNALPRLEFAERGADLSTTVEVTGDAGMATGVEGEVMPSKKNVMSSHVETSTEVRYEIPSGCGDLLVADGGGKEKV